MTIEEADKLFREGIINDDTICKECSIRHGAHYVSYESLGPRRFITCPVNEGNLNKVFRYKDNENEINFKINELLTKAINKLI